MESFLESIFLLNGSFFTYYITNLYCIHMPCVLIMYVYYISKINSIHSFIHAFIQLIHILNMGKYTINI